MPDTTYTGPILFLCGCQKYREYLEAAIRRMADPAWLIVAAVGGGEGVPVFDSATRILTLPVPDIYEALPEKVHAVMSWIHAEWPNASGVFKTDDDMLFPNRKLLAHVVRANQSKPYWGVTASMCMAAPVNLGRIQQRFEDKELRPTHQSAMYCFGAGYWVGKQALTAVCAAGAEYKKSALEDVCTGYVLNQAGFRPEKIPVPCREVPRGPELLAIGRS